MKIELANVKANDFVYCDGNSGFCDPSTEKVVRISIKYDSNTGIPYNVIILTGNRKFDSRDGHAMNPPTAYYVRPTDQEEAQIEQDEIDRVESEREIAYQKRKADKQAVLDKLTDHEKNVLGLLDLNTR